MLTLCLDTSFKYLTCALIENEYLISYKSFICNKKQSEHIFDTVDEVFKNTKYTIKDIDSMCIAIGPGSYTGVRISLTFAKTICHLFNIVCYTISTLNLYASNTKNAKVIIDARASRVYIGTYDEGLKVQEDSIIEVDKIESNGFNLIGDLSLIGKEDYYPNIAQSFLTLKKNWQKQDDVAHLNPIYLKSTGEYYR